MNTAIIKKFEVDEPIDKVWKYLTDPTKIVSCVPGASLTEQIDDRNFKGGVSLKFGPVKASYAGEIAFEDMDFENYKMTLNGKGLDSKGKGSADLLMKIDLNEREGGGTSVESSMQIGIVGKLAQFGSRLINDVTDQLFDQFVANFKAKLAEDTATEVAAMPVVEESEEMSEPANQATNVAEQATVSTPENVQRPVAPKVEKPQAQADNSLNVFALLWAIIKGFFARLFGGGKK
ncbi:MAG: SRPBCC family protein [Chitinophagales bacterium]